MKNETVKKIEPQKYCEKCRSISEPKTESTKLSGEEAYVNYHAKRIVKLCPACAEMVLNGLLIASKNPAIRKAIVTKIIKLVHQANMGG